MLLWPIMVTVLIVFPLHFVHLSY